MKNTFKFICLYIAAAALGSLLTVAFAPFEVFPLAIIAPAGLIWLIQNKTPKHAFFLGFCFGFGFFGAGIYWIFHSIHNIGNVPIPLSLFITMGSVAILSIYPAFACYLSNRFFPKGKTIANIFAFPTFWVFSEWTRSLFFTGFPWLLLGYSQTNSPLSGYAPILSVYGVSLGVILCSSLVFNAYDSYSQKIYKNLYFCLFSILVIVFVGGALNTIAWTSPSQHRPLEVSLVQGDIAQEIKWSPEHLQLSFDRYVDLTTPLWGKSDIIIWPEAAIPLPKNDAEEFLSAMNEQALKNHATLILGIPIRDEKNNSYYNSIIALGKDKGTYNKRHLVPFGEYTPFAEYISDTLKFMNIPMSDLISGDYQQPDFIIDGVKILNAICYEIAFPELMHSRDSELGLILTLSNDAWFGKSTAQAQHLQMAIMRSQEMRRPGLFVTNDGITAIISPMGKIVAQAPAYEPYVLNGTVQPTQGMTPWMMNGTDPLVVILIIFLVISVRAQKKGHPEHSEGSDSSPLAQNDKSHLATNAINQNDK